MSHMMSRKHRAVFIPGLVLALFALAVVLAPTFYQPGVQAVADPLGLQDTTALEGEVRLLETEFKRYLTLEEKESSASGEVRLSKVTLLQFWNRLSRLRIQAESLGVTPETSLDFSNHIAILEERIRKAVETAGGAQESALGPTTGTGAISGTVTDAGTAAPLANVTVQIYDATGAFEALAVTDSAGNYTTPAVLPSGNHYARTSNSIGYINELYNDLPCAVGCSVTSGTPIAVTTGTTTPNVNFALTAGGRIAGTVFDITTFAPLANIEVDIYTSNGTFITAGTTDAAGTYVSGPGLPTGTYYARTTNSMGYLNKLYNDISCFPTCDVTSGTPIVVTSGSTTGSINFALVVGGRISGAVTDATSGAPLAGVTVEIYNSNGTLVTSGITNGTGTYISASGLPTGSYRARTTNAIGYIDELYDNIPCLTFCSVFSGTPISVTGGATTPNINFGLNQGGRISGRVTDATTGAPLAGVTVQIYNFSGSFVTSGSTDSAGNYTSGILAAGTHYARTFNSQGYVDELYDNLPCPPNCTIASGTPIAVTAGATTSNINFMLAVFGRISGRVTDATTGAPLGGAGVQIYNANGFFVSSVSTDSSGNYTASGLTTGAYYARTFNGSGYRDELYDNIPCSPDCTITSGTPIPVTSGATTPNINFALNRGGGISGRVTDAATGAPLTSVRVQIYNANGFFVTSSFTDSVGNYFTFGNLAPGTYYASTSNSSGYIDELYDNLACFSNCNPTSGTPILVISEAITSNINFALSRGGRISGRVTDAATAAPLASVALQIYDAGGSLITTSFSDGGGNYLIVNLPAGTYYARTVNSSGYVDELYDDLSCASGCEVTSGTPILVASNVTTPNINFALGRASRIAGTVTSAATSMPLAGVMVQIFSFSGTPLVTSAVTDGVGNYVTPQVLAAGTYYARTANTGGHLNELYDNLPCATGCDVFTGMPITVPSNATIPNIDFALNRGGRIAGRVTDAATAVPLVNVAVLIFDSGGNLATSGVTNNTGAYISSDGLPTGTYYVRTSNSIGYIDELYDGITCFRECNVTTGTPISVTVGATTPDINFALNRGGSIAGRVTDAATAAPLANVRVEIYRPGETRPVAFAVTDSAGNYLTPSALATGTYYARTANTLGYVEKQYNNITCFPNCDPTSGTPIAVTTGATTTGVNFALNRGGRIAGTVTAAATGVPLAGVSVLIYDSGGNLVSTNTTDRFGNYTSGAGMPTGTYYARTANALGYINRLYDNLICSDCNPTSGTPIAVTTGATTPNINFALTPGGRISGTITRLGTAVPLVGVTVEIYDAAGALVTTGRTDNAGNYISAAGLATGSYFARTRNAQGFLDKLYNDLPCVNCDPTTGTPIAVTTGANTSGTNFALCRLTLAPATASFTASGGTGNFTVTPPASGGCMWTAASNEAWITVTSVSGGTVNYSVAANPSAARRAGSITVGNRTFTVLQGAAFLDVPPSHPFYTEIGKLSARGITVGCDGNNFCPEQVVTRQQMAAFLVRAKGEFNPSVPLLQRFNDVPPSNPFYNFIDRTAALRITLGCSEKPPLYCPADPVLREQMAAFIIRALGEFNPPPPSTQRFDDVPPSNPFYAFIDRLAALGITQGCSASPPLYCPTAAVTRGQMAAFLVRAFNL